jgi:predicted ferric reductase
MKTNYELRQIAGWIVIFLISIVPVFLWLIFGSGISDLTDYSSITHNIGKVFGLVGMTMFALTFVLSTRIKFIEDVFGGLDKVYIVHGILGGLALILILAHPIFLVLKFIPQNVDLAATYLLPTFSASSVHWSVNFGIFALAGMIVLIFITLYTKMKYRKWKFTHEFLGLVFVLAVLHIFLVRGTVSVDNIFDGYYFYAAAVAIVGLGAFSYSLLIRSRVAMNAFYKIKSVGKSKDLFILEMIPEYKPLEYKSGQFVFVRFYSDALPNEAHPFSIASKSNSPIMKIVVKKLGDFTEKLDCLKEGDMVSVEGPYGRFNYRNYDDKAQVWIGAGIGITPFLGMAEDLGKGENVFLYHTAREDSDLFGKNLFAAIAERNKQFKFYSWNSSKQGHLTVDEIKKGGVNLQECEFLICGPEKFKEDLIGQLLTEGVKKNRIHEEAFEFK